MGGGEVRYEGGKARYFGWLTLGDGIQRKKIRRKTDMYGILVLMVLLNSLSLILKTNKTELLILESEDCEA